LKSGIGGSGVLFAFPVLVSRRVNESSEGGGPGGEGEQVVQQQFQGQAAGRVSGNQVVEEPGGFEMKILGAAPQAM